MLPLLISVAPGHQNSNHDLYPAQRTCGPLLYMHLPICPSRVLNTYSSARFRSVSTHSLCCCPAVLSQDPAYSLPSLQTDRTALYREVASSMMPSDHEYIQSGLCPVQPMPGCSVRTMLMLHCRAVLTACCQLPQTLHCGPLTPHALHMLPHCPARHKQCHVLPLRYFLATLLAGRTHSRVAL